MKYFNVTVMEKGKSMIHSVQTGNSIKIPEEDLMISFHSSVESKPVEGDVHLNSPVTSVISLVI